MSAMGVNEMVRRSVTILKRDSGPITCDKAMLQQWSPVTAVRHSRPSSYGPHV
jgi:hypothetical protein